MGDLQIEDRLVPFDSSIFIKEYSYIPATSFTSISAYADYGTTVAGTVKVTRAAHGLSTGDVITQSGSTSYNGDFSVTIIDVDNYYITDTWVANDAAGAFVYLAANQGKIQFSGKALPTSKRALPNWQITRFVYDASSLIIRSVCPQASGNIETNGLEFAWDNRSTFIYGAE